MIRIEGLSKRYGPKEILKGVTYHFPAGEKIALVGPNGAGKTTLLKILCNLEESDSGSIVKPSQFHVGYLPQKPNPHPAPNVLEECLSGEGRMQSLRSRLEIAAQELSDAFSDKKLMIFEKAEEEYRNMGGYALEAKAKGILIGLGFNAEVQEKSPLQLSGGWRMRLELAKIFINEPEFLILDEPTNHLDLPSLVWVEKYLASHKGTLLFVSHDRSLLNRLATRTLFLHKGKMDDYAGNFDFFLEQKELKESQDASKAEQLRKRKGELQKFVDRFGAQATKAKQAQSRMKMIERLEDLESEFEGPDKGESMVMRLPVERPSGKEVLKVVDLDIGYSQKALCTQIQLPIHRGQKIAIIGANGIGKSTLLKSIIGKVQPIKGTVEFGHQVETAYFAQDQLGELDEDKSVLANVMSASVTLTEKQARSLLGRFLFGGDDVFKPVKVLSGGERSRVGLARVLSQSANFLILDEPTNHLDMVSCEVLADCMAEYQGTILFVSHDREFIDEVCSHVYAMIPEGKGRLFEGNLADYQRLAVLGGFPDVLDPKSPEAPDLSHLSKQDSSTSQTARANSKDEKRERQKKDRRVAEIEKAIATKETFLSQSEEKMLQFESHDFQRLALLAKEVEGVRLELAALETEWLELQS
jgi:ATP-binding cassette, subfamily F, member 3